jgi:signal transduction histidine kinase
VYGFIIASIAAFVMLAFESFSYVKSQMEDLAEQNRALIIKEIHYLTKTWLKNGINILEITAHYVNEDYANEEHIKKFSQPYLLYGKHFDTLQILIVNMHFYVNGIKVDDYKKHTRNEKYACAFNNDNKNVNLTEICSANEVVFKNYNEEHWYLERKWFQNTKNAMKTTMEIMESHGLLFEKTINLCTPVKDGKEEFKGVLCGITKVNSIMKKIESLEIPQNYYYFISDNVGNILMAAGDNALINKNVQEIFSKKLIKNSLEPQNIHVNNNVITIDNLIDFNWYIGAGIDEAGMNNDAVRKFFKHAAVIFGCFILFIAAINISYTFLYRRSEAKRAEYEKMLQYRSKISETGELISVINHQIRQPINALSLLINDTLNKLSSKEFFDEKEFEQNLRFSQRDILLISETIDIFRNFYSFNDTVSEFRLKNCIENVLYVTRTELSLNSIMINMDASNIEDVKIRSVENFVQQILLVLIQNAKDAILPLKVMRELHRRKIEITFEMDEKFVHIFVSDFGIGIAKEMKKRLFSEIKSSAKKQGSGMGLFFSKRLAKERLCGDLTLVNDKMPTIFKLTLAIK